jgi:hypothetical protein
MSRRQIVLNLRITRTQPFSGLNILELNIITAKWRKMRIKNPKLSAGRIPDILKISIMESRKKLTLVQKKDVVKLH